MSQQDNIIKTLRDLVPRRLVTLWEAERLTELQANRFRELMGISEPRLPTEAISELPRIQVEHDADLKVSGLTYWESGRWIIRLNTSEPHGRVRFSLCHEFKHTVDHTTKHWLYPAGLHLSPEDKAERLAEFFAACLLMPKRHVKRLLGERTTLSEMARVFDVTPRAMNVRLSQLGLIEPIPRCFGVQNFTSGRGAYHRALSLTTEVAA